MKKFILLATLFLSQITATFAEDNFVWSQIVPGLETTETTLETGALFSSSLRILRADLKYIRPSVIRTADYSLESSTARTITLRSKALAAINANFFDEKGDPLGLVISRGMVRQSIHLGGQTLTGVFMTTATGAHIVARNQFVPSLVVDAFQAGPRLVVNGSPVNIGKDLSYSKRSGVCIDENKKLILFSSSSGIWGITFDQLQKLLLSKNLKCQDALNLDGGGSAQLYIAPSEQFPELFLEGTDPVPLLLGLFPRSQ